MFSRLFGGKKASAEPSKEESKSSKSASQAANPTDNNGASRSNKSSPPPRFISRRPGARGGGISRPIVRRGSAESRPRDVDSDDASERNLLQQAKSLPNESTLMRKSNDTDGADPLSLREDSEPRLGASMPELNVLANVDETEPDLSINKALLSGYLWKQGGKRKNWHRRWFRLTDNTLFYYKSAVANEPLGKITDLHTCGLRSCDMKTKRPFSFEIYTIDRVYRISAESNAEYMRWINFLRGCMSSGNHIIFNPDTRSFEELKLVFRDNISISDLDFSDHSSGDHRETVNSEIFNTNTSNSDTTSSEEEADDDDDDAEEDDDEDPNEGAGISTIPPQKTMDLLERQEPRQRSNTLNNTAKADQRLSMPLQTAFVDQRMARGLLPEVDMPLFEESKNFVSIGVLKQGYLTKLGAIVKNWKRRWCVLIDEHLNYYKTPKHNIPCGSVHIDSSTYIERQSVLPSDRFPSLFCFKVVTAHRVFLFCADSNADLKDWLQVLSQIELNRQLARYKRRG